MSTPADEERPSPWARLYGRVVLDGRYVILLATAAVVTFFAFHLKNFKMDMSSDSIVLEEDRDLRYYDLTRDLFGSDDYVVLTVTPSGDLMSDAVLGELKAMSDKFLAMERVESVTSILTVPLFHSPNVPLMQLATNYKTLLMPECDHELARKELIENPLYNDYLISRDGRTTAVQVTFKDNPESDRLSKERRQLREERKAGTITEAERERLATVEREYDAARAVNIDNRREDIERIRQIMNEHQALGELHLGGVPMIVADIIEYVERDILDFGAGVLAFILLMLAVIFRKVKWVLLPTLTCVLTVVVMMGYLGFRDWRTTIVTANFSSILLIMTMSMAIHVVVRYREIYAGHPELPNREIVLRTVRHVGVPCLFMALTTIVGFASLLVSRIRPVMDFGLMMTIGLGVAYLLCFVFFPAALLVFPKGAVPPRELAELKVSFQARFARFMEAHKAWVGLGSLALLAVCAVGITRLKVENRFIDYFRERTEIYQGMTEIDNKLGGTTPLEVVVEGEGKDYWIETANLDRLRHVHQWLDDLPETGKVISPVTMLEIVQKVNNGQPVPTPLLKIIRSRVPEEIARAVLKPYVSPDYDQVRIAMRARESDKTLRRKELLAKMREHLDNNPYIAGEKAHITGMFVLYNNMLQSLFKSQILTIGTVVAAIWLMFVVLFRSFLWATIAIAPNLLPVVLVLGTLGWTNIPLDMMTIMIAAITMGIAVDDTIHYIHRFREEFPRDRNYRATMYRCHNSIGRAMSYTSVVIVAGFSILTFSNFVPTIYFGVFTGLAMIVALLAAMMLLPLLILIIRPLGPGEAEQPAGATAAAAPSS